MYQYPDCSSTATGAPRRRVRILHQGLALLTSKFDALDPDRVALLGLLADKLSRLGRDAEAEPLCRERRSAVASTLGRSDPEYEGACVALSDVLVNLGRPDEAESLLRETLEVAEGDGGPVEVVIRALTRLGWHLVQMEPFDEAETCYRMALSRADQSFGREGVVYSEALDNLGWMIGMAGRYEEAEAIHRETTRLRATTPGCGSEVYFNSFSNLSWVLWRMGREHDAEAVLDAGLAAMRAASGAADPLFLRALDRTATACRDEGDFAAAARHFRALRAFLTEHFGPTDPRTMEAAEALAFVEGDRPIEPTLLQ